MSMPGMQIKELREKADELRNVHVDDENVGLLFAAIGTMREAADTIEKLEPHSNQLEPSRYFELFGTPERAARTLRGETPMCDTCELNGKPCWEKGYYGCAQLNDYDALIEWLRGDAE